jgi:hypothetical protein
MVYASVEGGTSEGCAGVIVYWAFLTGRKVIYIGRKGELHIEEFPNAKLSSVRIV